MLLIRDLTGQFETNPSMPILMLVRARLLAIAGRLRPHHLDIPNEDSTERPQGDQRDENVYSQQATCCKVRQDQ